MNTNELKYNLLGTSENRLLLEFQSEVGTALRGGSLPMFETFSSARRLVHTINILSNCETRELAKPETIQLN